MRMLDSTFGNHEGGISLDTLPKPIRDADRFVRWKIVSNKNGAPRKTPVSAHGWPVGYNDSAALVDLGEASRLIRADSDANLGITLLDGLPLQINGQEGWLWVLDFDGFVEVGTENADAGVAEFLKRFPAYAEYSPSGTGLKYYFVGMKSPRKKTKVKFSPSAFFEKHPKIEKYERREIEVFSQNTFIALTGQPLPQSVADLPVLSSARCDELDQYLADWAEKSWKGDPAEVKLVPDMFDVFRDHKLEVASLEVVLGFIDHVEEESWSDVSNALARGYGEAGRSHFQKFSKGEFHPNEYPAYDENECDRRFSRSLKELIKRPDGVNIGWLVQKAKGHADWQEVELCYEPSKRIKAEPISQEKWAAVVANWPGGFNDQAPASGQRNQVESGYQFLAPQDLLKLPPPKWLIKNLVPATGIATLYGPSKSGKTFLVLDLLASIALGRPFFGRRVATSSVTYVCLEGGAGLANRIRAYETYHGVKLPNDTFKVVLDEVSLFKSDITKFARAVNEFGQDGGIIVIDTLAQASKGADENSSGDMGLIIGSAQKLQKITGGLVLLIHHVGKDVSRGQRGHSSLEGAIDAAIEVRSPNTGRVWIADKVKDGVRGMTEGFRLEVIELGYDDDGDVITSCVALDDTSRAPVLQPVQGKHQQRVYQVLQSKYAKGAVVSWAVLLDLALSVVTDVDRPSTRAAEALRALERKGYLQEQEGEYQIM